MKFVNKKLLLPVLLLLGACSELAEVSDLVKDGKLKDPHEAFVRRYSYWVGKDMETSSGYLGTIKEDFEQDENLRKKLGFLGFRKLSNGNWELETSLYYRGVYRLPWSRDCLIYYEYAPDKQIVLSWRYEGSNEDCAVSPYQ